MTPRSFRSSTASPSASPRRGFELLHYRPANAETGLAVETIVRTGS